MCRLKWKKKLEKDEQVRKEETEEERTRIENLRWNPKKCCMNAAIWAPIGGASRLLTRHVVRVSLFYARKFMAKNWVVKKYFSYAQPWKHTRRTKFFSIFWSRMLLLLRVCIGPVGESMLSFRIFHAKQNSVFVKFMFGFWREHLYYFTRISYQARRMAVHCGVRACCSLTRISLPSAIVAANQ